MKKTIDLYGRLLDIYTEEGAYSLADDFIVEKGIKTVIRLNENIFDNIRDGIDVDNWLAKADLILCSNNDLDEPRTTNNGFYIEMLKRLEDKSIVIISNDDEVMERLKTYITNKFPTINIKATKNVDGSSDIENTVNFINNYVPTAVIVSLPSPIQEQLLLEHKLHMNTRLAVGIGEKPEILGYKIGRLAQFFRSKNSVKSKIANYEI